jgi:hypothetical protein
MGDGAASGAAAGEQAAAEAAGAGAGAGAGAPATGGAWWGPAAGARAGALASALAGALASALLGAAALELARALEARRVRARLREAADKGGALRVVVSCAGHAADLDIVEAALAEALPGVRALRALRSAAEPAALRDAGLEAEAAGLLSRLGAAAVLRMRAADAERDGGPQCVLPIAVGVARGAAQQGAVCAAGAVAMQAAGRGVVAVVGALPGPAAGLGSRGEAELDALVAAAARQAVQALTAPR